MPKSSVSPRPDHCENQRCASGFKDLYAIEVPIDFPESLGNPVTDIMNDQLDTPGPGYRPGLWRRILQRIGLAAALLAVPAEAGSPVVGVLIAPARAVVSVFRCAACERDASGNIKRSKAKARKFRRVVGWNLPTDGVRVDHIISLACGPDSGAYDDLGNMQLQWVTAALDKDRIERDVRACDPATQAAFYAERGQLMPNPHSRTQPPAHAYESAARMKQEYATGRRR